MSDGYVRVAAATPEIRVADPEYNVSVMMEQIQKAAKQQVKILVFPELCLTGYTCQDLFCQQTLIEQAENALLTLAHGCAEQDMLVIAGLPYRKGGKLYNVAAAIKDGKVLALIPKSYLPNYSEFYEMRHFVPADQTMDTVWIADTVPYEIPFGTDLLLECENIKELCVAIELCEDLWVPAPPSVRHALAGATLIANCSASDEIVGKETYRRELVTGQSARLVCSYIYASAGEGESTQDLVFSGDNLIAENGSLLAQSKRFETGLTVADVDLYRLCADRRKMTTFCPEDERRHKKIRFRYLNLHAEGLKRFIDPSPFVPNQEQERAKRCDEILNIQALGLKKRLKHTGCRQAVIGISGGLDSTLALLVCTKAFDLLSIPRENITAVTMPCFGTTDRTYQNAVTLTKRLGASLREVDIRAAVLQHFADIGHDPKDHSVTYENGQARERTQVLMDIANQVNGMVIGTGDMSELALGWATYNGDHMSMYGVNAGVPKTLVRHLVHYYAQTTEDQTLSEVLLDILDTPVSPELLPPEEGQISQKTEDLVGPYELHDFYLYQILRYGYTPTRIFDMAVHAFAGVYEKEVILKWLKVFYRRFFSQQFKRSCLPDGPKVGSVAVSPRGDLRMPSDAAVKIWLEELEKIG